MAFYRCGGGSGIPSQVNTDMNNVLNKKFSTAGQTYPPLEWAEDVNLLGLLEEKTASGAIAHITDGADGVPVKNWLVTLPASLDGYSEVNGTKNTGTGTPETQYIASLGRTIYGGQADIVTGEGSETYGYIVFDGSENWGSYSAYNGYYIGISDMKSGTRQDGVCNQLTCSKSTAQGQTDAFWLGVSNKNLYVIGVYDSMGSTLEAFKAYLSENPLILVYPLATPETFTFTPIQAETELGTNNFWANEGDSDVTYRSSGTTTPVPVVPTLITKSITENGTYSAEDDDADGYSEVTVNVSGGGGGSCERLMYARCANNDIEEIPAISNLDQGTNYSSYLSYDSTTRKFTVLQDFTGVVVAWVYAYRAYDINRPDGVFYLNNVQMLAYETTGNAQGSTGGRSGIYNFKQGDTFWVYTPTRHGYPQQNCKVYLVSELEDDIFTFADEEEEE